MNTGGKETVMFARMLAAAAVTLALAFAPSFVGDAGAAKKKPMNKMCMAKGLDGKAQSFKCKADEKCCFDYGANKGNCIAASAVCF
jgi:hypothetical protein